MFKKFFTSLLFSLTLLSMLSPASAAEQTHSSSLNQIIAPTWQFVDDGWYFLDDAGSPKTGWHTDDGISWYYLSETGHMQTGWVTDGTNRYYLGLDGIMQTGWVTDGTNRYYLGLDGIMQTGWVTDGTNRYYLGLDGIMQTGLIHDGSNSYYLNSDGIMQTGWVRDATGGYFFGSDGIMQTGWIFDGTSWYCLTETGTVQTGWMFDGTFWYYFSETGAMQTGWLFDGISWYYLSDNTGEMQTGWLLDGATWYYFSDTGVMQTGWVDNGTAFCDDTGAWIPNYSDSPIDTSIPETPVMSETEIHIRSNLQIVGTVSEEEINAYVSELLKAPAIAHSNIKTYVLSEYDSYDTLHYLLGEYTYLSNPRPEDGTVGITHVETMMYGSDVHSTSTIYLISTVNFIKEATIHELGHSIIHMAEGYINNLYVDSFTQQLVIDYYDYDEYCSEGEEWYAETYMHYISNPTELASFAPAAYDYFAAVEAQLPAAKERNDMAALEYSY